MFLLVPAYPGCPGSKAVKRSLLLAWLLFLQCSHKKAFPFVHHELNDGRLCLYISITLFFKEILPPFY